MNPLLTAGDVCRLLKLPASTLNWWLRKDDFVEPLTPGRGKGVTKIFNLHLTWAINLAIELRKAGNAEDFAVKVGRAVALMDADQILADFDAGRTILLVFSVDGKVEVMSRLVKPGAVTDNAELKRQREAAKTEGILMSYTGIDIRPMYLQLVDAFEEMKKTTASKLRTSKR